MSTTEAAKGSLSTSLKTDWADGEYTFRLTYPGTLELEEKCGGVGFSVILARLASATPHLVDIRETIRLGLIGGGLEPSKAATLVRRYVDDRPQAESIIVARTILLGLMYGFEQPSANEPLPPSASAKVTATGDNETKVTAAGDTGQPTSPPPVTTVGLNDVPGAALGQPQSSQRAATLGPISMRLLGN